MDIASNTLPISMSSIRLLLPTSAILPLFIDIRNWSCETSMYAISSRECAVEMLPHHHDGILDVAAVQRPGHGARQPHERQRQRHVLHTPRAQNCGLGMVQAHRQGVKSRVMHLHSRLSSEYREVGSGRSRDEGRSVIALTASPSAILPHG